MTAPYVLTVAVQKGGTGKTSTVWALADGLSSRGLRVLVIDMDSQGSLSSIYQVGSSTSSSYELMTGARSLYECIVPAPLGDIVPHSPKLSRFDAEFGSKKGRGRLLADALRIADGYDFIIIDTPPGMGLTLSNAIIASDGLLVPVQADKATYDTIPGFLRTVREARPRDPVDLLGFVMVRTVRTNLGKMYAGLIAEAAEASGTDVIGHVPTCEDVNTAIAFGMSLFSSKDYARSTARKAYGEIIDRILERTGRKWDN